MTILGISCFYHDAAAAVLKDGKIIAAAQEERFTRKKHDADFPSNAISYCLRTAGCSLQQLDAIVFYDKPFLKFERLLETYYQNAPAGFLSFVKAMPVWLKEKLFIKSVLKKEFKKIDPLFQPGKARWLFTEHHLAHAASAFFVSPFQEAAIVTIDGVGEWATASLGIGSGNSIKILKELVFPDSVGLLYSAFTYFLGFKVNSGEYKLMGLAPYGNAGDEQTRQFIEIIEKELVTVFDNGSIRLNQRYFGYATGLKMIRTPLWEELFGIKRRLPEQSIEQAHCNLAMAIQHVTEKIVLQVAAHAKAITGRDNLCMAGGVALNCVANGKLQRASIFSDIYIQPAAGDAGGALGAALAVHYIYFNSSRDMKGHPRSEDPMQNAFLGPAYSSIDIQQTIQRFNAVGRVVDSQQDLAALMAAELMNGKILGWFHGRMEFGPRALGNRSILASPLFPNMQERLNRDIKFRENFRPFAPVTTVEDVNLYTAFAGKSPYMLQVHPIKEDLRIDLPDGFHRFTPEQKMQVKKSLLPSVTHVDFSCRVQTADRENNGDCWKLLEAFKKLSGYAVLVNTSFNVRGEPVVCTPDQAYTCFMKTGMDVLVLNDTIFYREDQPPFAAESWTAASVAAD